MQQRLRFLVGFRLVAVTSALLPIALVRLGSTDTAPETGFLFGWTTAAYTASLFYLVLLLLKRPTSRVQGYLQCIGDLALITALAAHYGTTTPFSILYLVVITVASVLLERRAGIVIATLAWLGYACVLVGDATGWQPGMLASTAWLRSGRLLYNASIHLAGFYAVAVLTSNLSQRATTVERALREKRKHLADLQVAHRDIVESMPSGLVTTDFEGFITSANEAAQEILGVSRERLRDLPIYSLGLIERAEWEELAERARGGQRLREEASYELEGEHLQVGYTINPLTRGDGSLAGYILIFQDLTEWRQLQEAVRLKDRMAAVGEMASGLAHEVGNPLAAISGSVQMLSSTYPRDTSQHRLLDIILKESKRLDRTIRGFLQFARPAARSSVRFDIAALLADHVELLRNSEEVRPDHQIELELDSPKVVMMADRDQISQIFWNLARNALRALSDGGVLRISGRAAAGIYSLTFEDSGRGMTEEERAKLFHPFRSFFDGGTGIGMAIVYRIVEEHGGQLRVESEPGEGTSITIEIPGIQSIGGQKSA